MALDDERTRTSNMTGFQKFFDSPTCSDITLKISSVYVGLDWYYHAHKVILVAGSGYFNRKHEEGNAAEWGLEREFIDTNMVRTAIRHMYGFDFPGEDGHLEDFAEVGAIAEKYEIAGLPELVLPSDSRALDDCMSVAAKLEGFLKLGRLSNMFSGDDPEFDYAVKIILDNIAKLRKHEAFQELLNKEHGLAVAILNLSVERQSQVPGGNEDLE